MSRILIGKVSVARLIISFCSFWSRPRLIAIEFKREKPSRVSTYVAPWSWRSSSSKSCASM
jgi:hypothetical protein